MHLIQAAQKGDDLAMGLILQSHWEGLYNHLIQLNEDATIVEDATVITFTKAFKKLDQYDMQHAFTTWLYRIGKNSLIDLLKKKDPLAGSVPLDWTEELGWNIEEVDDQKGPEDHLIHEERKEWLQEMIQELDESYAKLIRLRYLEELSYAEVAERLNMPLGTVKVRLFRAHGLLKDIIKRSSF